MASFKTLYQTIFQTFGYPLSERTALAPQVLAEAEQRLGVRVPGALRDYYLVAGQEQRFNACCHRLLPPSKWSVEKQRLVFMEENQCVCRWSVVLGNSTLDPPVSEGAGDEPATWSTVHRKCSRFLAAMLHHQAVSGGLPHGFGTVIDPSKVTQVKFDIAKWTHYGELKGEHVYSRASQVFCFSFFDLPIGRGWMVSAGAKTKRDLEAIAAELGVGVKVLGSGRGTGRAALPTGRAARRRR